MTHIGPLDSARERWDELVAFAANTPGQIRGPKARLLPFPARALHTIELLDEVRAKLGRQPYRGAAGVPVPAVATLAELSTRAVKVWRNSRTWDLTRGRANDVLAGGRLTIGNAIADAGLRTLDGTALRFRIPRRPRTITMPVRLYRTPLGALVVVIAVHIPTGRAASAKTRRRMVRAIARYTRRCAAAGFPVILSGDWNGAHVFLPDDFTRAASADVQAVYVLGEGIAVTDHGAIAEATGTVTDHRGGIPWALLRVLVTDHRRPVTLPRGRDVYELAA